MAVMLSGRGTIPPGQSHITIHFSTAFSSVPSVVLLPGTNGTAVSANAQNVNLYITSVETFRFRIESSGPAADTCYFDYRAMTT
jgi:hypothetical protein